MNDWRMQQELEEERAALSIAALRRVANGTSNQEDARFLASELGLTKQFQQESKHEMA